jgi:hypothetical protein
LKWKWHWVIEEYQLHNRLKGRKLVVYLIVIGKTFPTLCWKSSYREIFQPWQILLLQLGRKLKQKTKKRKNDQRQFVWIEY